MGVPVSGVRAKVRIGLIINAQGKWVAHGWKNAKDEHVITSLQDGMDDADPVEQIFWIEAEVPVPIAQTVHGEVKP